MNKTRKTLVGILILLVVIQTIQPIRNISDTESPNDISKTFEVNDKVYGILKEKCYDCHSNNTRYPWYNYIQPAGWWLAAHIYEGKEHLNFSEFKTYTAKRQSHKLREIYDAVNEGWMPLETYIWLHKDAKITAEDRDAINAWIENLPVKMEEKK
jgi:uncharacterized membrane protein